MIVLALLGVKKPTPRCFGSWPPDRWQAYVDAIKCHSDVVRPVAADQQVALHINPYHLGFAMWEKIVEKDGMDAARFVPDGGGRTVYDQDLHALFLILAKWTSAASYSSRVNDLLTGNGTPQLSAAQITDAYFDTVIGDADNELFFFSAGDTVAGKNNTETAVKVS